MADEPELDPTPDLAVGDSAPDPQTELDFSEPADSVEQTSSQIESVVPAVDPAEQYRQQVAYLQQQNFQLQRDNADAAYRYQQSLQSQKPHAQPEAKDQQPWWGKKWSPPKDVNKKTFLPWIDEATGNWKPSTPSHIPQQYQEWKDFHNNFDEQFRSNPFEYLYDGMRDKLMEDFRQEYAVQQQQQQEHQFAQQMVQGVAEWAQARDAAGNPIYYQDQQGRQLAALTPQGQRFSQLLGHYQQHMPLSEASRVAWAMFAQEQGIGQQQQQAAPAEPPVDPAVVEAERKKNFTRQGKANGHAPGRGGRIAAANDPLAPEPRPSKMLADMFNDHIRAGNLTEDEAAASF